MAGHPKSESLRSLLWLCLVAAITLGALIVGYLALLAGAALVGITAWLSGVRPPAGVVPAGVGAVLLYVAWVQRRGPGTICSHAAGSLQCKQYLSPIPWLVGGAVLVLTGLVAMLVGRGRASSHRARR